MSGWLAISVLAIFIVVASVARCNLARPRAQLKQERLNTPKFHFVPARNWMNDPNGLVYHDGEYHLCYQYNPYGDTWGHMSWGHAVSADLVHWTELGVAIPETSVLAFSGSAVVDETNTSGFGGPGESPLVAIYTGADMKAQRQAQRVVFSLDRGRTWSEFAGNPVLDLNRPDFRDPKVFWHGPGARWIMVVAHAEDKEIGIYSSRDLKQWTAESAFGPAGAIGGAWECPDLFELPVEGEPGETRWVMIVSLNQSSGPSGAQYFVGTFDGLRFEAETGTGPEASWVDEGADFYAPQSWSHVPVDDGRRVVIGWAANWRYAAAMPTYPARGAMSLPRSVSLVRTRAGLRLRQRPVAELKGLRRAHRSASSIRVAADRLDLGRFGLAGSSLEFTLDLDTGAAQQILFTLGDASGYQTVLGINPPASEVFVDRTRAGPHFHDAFAGRHTSWIDLSSARVRLHVFVDQSILEVFIEDGMHTITERFFPGDSRLRWNAQALGGEALIRRVESWHLEAAAKDDT